jgi:hypothetical protein
MFMAYGRLRSCGAAWIVGGLVGKPTDALGNAYPLNDSGYASATDCFSRLTVPAAGQTAPNFRSVHTEAPISCSETAACG